MTRLLVVVAVPAERDAVLDGVHREASRLEVSVVTAGVGVAAAAATTASTLVEARLSGRPFDAVLSAGVGGGFPGVAPLGTAVVATQVVAADLGAQRADGGFAAIDDLGFGTGTHPVPRDRAERAARALRGAGLSVVCGPVLTVCTVTGTAGRAAELAARHPGAAAEGMEGFGVATAAAAAQLPCGELRTVSNPVGPRDRAAWRLPQALRVLTEATTALADSSALVDPET